MSDKPLRIFIASASEGLDVAEAVQDALRADPSLDPRIWNQGTFKPSMTFIEALEAELDACDFAVLTLTPDDQSQSRGKVTMAPRDNVLFEMGLFMGRLGRERTYFIYDRGHDLKVPTDLLGVNPASFKRADGEPLEAALAPACAAMAARMRELGPRHKHTHESEIEYLQVRRFSERVCGTWWGYQEALEGDSWLSLFQIRWDDGHNAVQMEGESYDPDGRLFGRWYSVATGVRVKERTIFFSWEGTHPKRSPLDIYKGFGQYTFEDAEGAFDCGDGLFSDIQMGRNDAAVWKSVDLRRLDGEDLARVSKVMKDGSKSEQVAEIQRALAMFTGPAGQAG